MRAPHRLGRNGFATGLTGGLAIGFACVAIVGSVNAALAECKPGHLRPPFFIKTMGQCGFNSETLSFRGTPAQQAMCLMRGMDATRNLGPLLEGLPPGLAKRIGETAGLPTRERLSAYLSKLDLEWDFAMYLWQPLSRAHDNDPGAPMAKYFVIHDTSGPNYRHRAFPDDINVNPKINNLRSFACSDEWGKAHVVVNRMGDMLVNHDYSIPWRETKFEQAAEFGDALKGLFVHNELIQPRRAGPHGGDAGSPDPAFTQAQYDRLALLYVIASVRAGRWLIPAFHAALDADIRNGHDDPLNFKIDSFADSLDRLMEKLQGAEQFQASNATTATDAQPDTPPPTSDGFWIDALWGTPRKTAAAPAIAAVDGAPKPNADVSADGAAVKPPDAAIGQVNPNQVSPNQVNSNHANFNPVPNSTAMPVLAAVVKSPPLNAKPETKVAARESEAPHEQKSADAKECTTHHARGHRHQSCAPDNTADHDRGRQPERSADRSGSGQSDSARRHGGDAHAHHAQGHAQGSSRHHKS